MKLTLVLESNNIEDYIKEIPPIVQFHTPLIQKQIKNFEQQTNSLTVELYLNYKGEWSYYTQSSWLNFYNKIMKTKKPR